MPLYRINNLDGLDVLVPATDGTHPLMEKQERDMFTHETAKEQVCEDSMALTCFKQQKNGCWTANEFKEGRNTILIGSDSYASDIKVKEDEVESVQVILKLIGETWYIIERGNKSLLSINGVKKRQGKLGKQGTSLIKVGETNIVLSTLQEGNVFKSSGEERKKTFAVRNGQSIKTFNFDTPVLIGFNSVCGLKTNGKDFEAVIFPVGNKLYVYSFNEQTVHADGKYADAPIPVRHNSQITVEKSVFGLILSEEDQNSIGFNVIPVSSKPHLCLLELNEDDSPGNKLIMPETGRAIFLGRGKENYFTIESKSISRQHAQLIIYDSGLLLLDCYSTNGVYINQQKVGRKMAHPGDIVNFGDHRYLLCYSERK